MGWPLTCIYLLSHRLIQAWQSPCLARPRITFFLAYSAALPTPRQAATWPMLKSFVFLQWRYLPWSKHKLLPHRVVEGIIKHLQLAIHECYASLRIDDGEMIEGSKKWQSHTASSTWMFLIFKDQGPLLCDIIVATTNRTVCHRAEKPVIP